MKRFRQILAAVVLLGTGTVAAMPIGLRMVFWNNHSERAADIVVEVGGGKTVTVPRAWIAGRPAIVAAAGGDAAEAVRNGIAANGRRVWECYVVGLDPEIATNDFRITSFPMKADGTPDFGGMTVDPPPSQWNVPATWKVKGATTLDGPWEDVDVSASGCLGETALPMRFFKVEVVLP